MGASLGDLGHYAGPATLILSSLADGPKHGYALMKDVEAFWGVQLQPGTSTAPYNDLNSRASSSHWPKKAGAGPIG